MSLPLLELQALACERDQRLLFHGLNVVCQPGDVLQIVGPNGSGKTTLLRALTGLSDDYQGQILWRGQPVAQVRNDFQQSLLYLGHQVGVKAALTPRENLDWYRALQLSQAQAEGTIDQALAEVGLAGFGDTPCLQLSAGQLRRVALARLYLSEAPLWVLDEPFTAIDVRGVASLEARFAAHAERGGVLLLTSHQALSLPTLRQVDLGHYQPAPGAVSYAE
ncbi:cytochrome c biogenesis heme-transporting ATPase CcmA [Marinimicrobium alkaliphilum]|uniref:cytochrome c biogenesis heme-transporting ATPase CcmA n=1 Tax=Marinimicrobium alkaliphilum TaxID=2202654 RepID=UPI000DBA273A|nr:cytochrome c biogenesis heme-transporting ATPase CcmA [Marinimicrobium alkaliphilum]